VTERKVSKLKIAREYIDAAIEFFLARRNFFCVIHLAGAAEELFGKYLPKRQRIFTLAWKAEKALQSETGPIPTDKQAQKSVNKWKNEVKHMDDGTPRTLTIDLACTRFRRQRVRCFDGAGGGSWRDGSSRGSSSLRPCA
jgi:hypothetical protein